MILKSFPINVTFRNDHRFHEVAALRALMRAARPLRENGKVYQIPVNEKFHRKRVKSILVNLKYLRFKLLKYKENNKKICNTLDHNFKNIPKYILRNVSLEMCYFVLYDGALTLKMSKMALNPFCDKTLPQNHPWMLIP